LKTKNLLDSRFLTIRWIRVKAVVETRIEHADQRAGTGVALAQTLPTTQPNVLNPDFRFKHFSSRSKDSSRSPSSDRV